MWLKMEVQANYPSTTKRFEELRTKRSDGSMPLSRSAVAKAPSCLWWPVLERFTSTCCQATNRVRAVAIGYDGIWPHDEAYQAFSAEYLAGWCPSNRSQLGTCRCIANLSSGVLQLSQEHPAMVPHRSLEVGSRSRFRTLLAVYVGCRISLDGVVKMMRSRIRLRAIPHFGVLRRAGLR